MHLILVLMSALVLGTGLWLQNEVSDPIQQWWWVFLVAGFIIVCCSEAVRSLESGIRVLVTTTCAAILLGLVLLTAHTLLIYLFGATLLVTLIVSKYMGKLSALEAISGLWPMVGLVALSLMVLPIPLNRIQVILPNLSAGTLFTAYRSLEQTPGLDANFYNQINDHSEVIASLGTQIFFSQQHQGPLLKIKTLRPKIVVRLTSVIYETRLVFFRLPLLELSGEQLLALHNPGRGSNYRTNMDRGWLLIDQLTPTEDAWIQLPHMEQHSLSPANRGLAVLIRVLLWLVLCFSLVNWAPKKRVVDA